MNVIFEWLHGIYVFLAFVPFVAFFITWFIVYGFSRNKRQSTYWSMDVTTLFLIGSLAYMSRAVFQSSWLLWIVILLFLIAAGVLGNLQNRIRGKLNVLKIAKTLSRLGFLVLTALYVLLMAIGIGKSMLIQ